MNADKFDKGYNYRIRVAAWRKSGQEGETRDRGSQGLRDVVESTGDVVDDALGEVDFDILAGRAGAADALRWTLEGLGE